jgi:hypothetical protein
MNQAKCQILNCAEESLSFLTFSNISLPEISKKFTLLSTNRTAKNDFNMVCLMWRVCRILIIEFLCAS